MALTYSATFRPERRRYQDTGELIEHNVPLLLDLCYNGRSWYSTGIRLQHINDFDVKTQKLIAGKRALENKESISATRLSSILDSLKGHISEAFNDAKALKIEISAKYLIEQLKIRSGNKRVEIIKEKRFIEDFISAYNRWFELKIIGENRKRHYQSTCNIIERFLKLKNLTNITSKEFTSDILMDLQSFMLNEVDYINDNISLYSDLNKRNTPKKRNQNTVASKLKMLKTFFDELEEKDIVSINPFRKIAKREREAMLKEFYDEPIYLSLDELSKIINNECPDDLERVRDCFLLNCALGSRVGDFHSLTWDNVIFKDNFCYIHYVPAKTSSNSDLMPIDTPLVKFAFDIIMKYKSRPDKLLVPAFINNVSGKDG